MSLDGATATSTDVAATLGLGSSNPTLEAGSNWFAPKPLPLIRAAFQRKHWPFIALLVLPVPLDSSDDVSAFAGISRYFTLVTNEDGIGLYRRIRK
jgi:hypothetical protein